MTFTSDYFLKSKYICGPQSNKFVSASYSSFSVIQVSAVCKQLLLLIYIYICVSIGPCVACVILSMCVISNYSTSKNH